MDSLRVTIGLCTPMVEPGDLFHLDALLGALRVARERERRGEDVDPTTLHHDLPLERYESPSGEWVFKASAFRLTKIGEPFNWMQTGRLGVTEAARHRTDGFLALRAAKPNLAGGPFKTSLYHVPTVWATLTAYCIGEVEAVRELLSRCRQVGGRRGVGFGQVASVAVDVVLESDCLWRWRAMPADAESLDSEGYALAMACLRPPYWDRAESRHALVPTN